MKELYLVQGDEDPANWKQEMADEMKELEAYLRTGKSKKERHRMWRRYKELTSLQSAEDAHLKWKPEREGAELRALLEEMKDKQHYYSFDYSSGEDNLTGSMEKNDE